MGIKTRNLSNKYAQAFFGVYGLQMSEQDFWLIKKTVLSLTKNNQILTFFGEHNWAELQDLNLVFLQYFNLPAIYNELLKLLQKHKRMILLPEILSALTNLYLHKNSKLFFKIESYPGLALAQILQITNYLAKQTGAHILYEYSENKKLIAGISMQGEQLLYDDTVRYRLQKIRRKLHRA